MNEADIQKLISEDIDVEKFIGDLLSERYAKGSRGAKLAAQSPGQMVIALLTVGTGLALANRAEKFLSQVFVDFTRDRDFKSDTDRILYNTLTNINHIIKPKLHPMLDKLSKAARSGEFNHMQSAGMEKYLRNLVMASLSEASPQVDAELDKLAVRLRHIILSGVTDRLIAFLYQEGVRSG